MVERTASKLPKSHPATHVQIGVANTTINPIRRTAISTQNYRGITSSNRNSSTGNSRELIASLAHAATAHTRPPAARKP
ncbi:MAG: hypothetical protein AAF716_17775 [Cyanobacteria bacterium P01_D01_bin.1]